jgi:hypothetical protein
MKLLNDVNSKKQAYQLYTITHGIETIRVQIPIREVREFETNFQNADNKDRSGLLSLVSKHGGKVRA